MRTRLTTMAAAILIALPAVPAANAQTPRFQWAKRIASTLNPDMELSIGLAIDRATNIYVTGWFDGTNNFGGVTLTNSTGGGQDVFLAKYDSMGTLQWARRAGSATTNWEMGRGIGVDTNGNVYVTGGFRGDADFGTTNVSAPDATEFFLAKYDSAGTVQWVRQSVAPCTSGAYGTGLAVDAAGNSYAVGYFDGCEIRFGTNNLIDFNPSDYRTFLVKHDNAGMVRWAQLIGGPGLTYATKVAVDAAGNVYVRGAFTVSVTIGTSNLVASPGGAENMFVAKFNNSGALTWVQRTTGADIDEGGVAVDQAGNVYVSGWFDSGTVSFGSTNLSNSGSLDAFVAKYNSSGVLQWARRQGGSGVDVYWDCAVDAAGNAYAAGALMTSGAISAGSRGAMIAKYDPAGTVQWAKSVTGSAASPVSSLVAKCAVDSGGSCYLAGWYRTATTFDTNVLQTQGYWAYFIAKVGFTPPTLRMLGWSNATARISVSGEAGNRFALEYVPAFAGSNTWRRLATNTLTSSPLTVTDTNATNSSRFYQAILVP